MSWRHWFREVAVIAAGALAALAAQAWWQDRQDAERERDYLRHLLADTRENVRRIDEAIAADSASESAQARIADVLYGAGAALPADLGHLRGIRDETRQLLAALQARHPTSGAPAPHDSAPRPPK